MKEIKWNNSVYAGMHHRSRHDLTGVEPFLDGHVVDSLTPTHTRSTAKIDEGVIRPLRAKGQPHPDWESEAM